MTFDPTDPRLTAYVLDDPSLSDAERTEVAELLAHDAEANRFAEELRASAKLFGECLAKEPKPAVADAPSLEAAVLSEMAKPTRNWRSAWTFWAVACGVVLIAGAASMPMFIGTMRARMAGAVDFKRRAQPSELPEPGIMRDSAVYFPKSDDFPLANELADAQAAEVESRVVAEREKLPSRQGQAGEHNINGSVAIDVVKDAEQATVMLGESGAAAAPRDLVVNNLRSLEFDAGKPQSGSSNTELRFKESAGDGAARGGQPPARFMLPAKPSTTQPNSPPVGGVRLGEMKPDEPAIAYIQPKSWEELSVRRQADLAGQAETTKENKARHDLYDAMPVEPAGAVPAKTLTPSTNPHLPYSQGYVANPPADGLTKLERVAPNDPLPGTSENSGPPPGPPQFYRMRGEARTGFNTEAYPTLTENEFLTVNQQNALSTFSIDVDTASYANVRRFLTQNALPPAGAVRIEEMVNYFPYAYPPPVGDVPFAVHLETAECPWNPQHRLARIALKGKEIDNSKRPPSNLVFLLDVSGSMNEPNKLPLVKASLKLLVDQLGENDRVAIAVYAGSSGLVLDGTRGDKKTEILYAIDNLQPSGSTNGAAGIKLAYEVAVKSFIKGGTNRVILCTDGDFNVGVSSDDELVSLITEKAKTGVFLSVLGFGMGNYKDAKMMQLADKGNGNYAYIDSLKEGKKVLVEQMSGTLVTIAKDVKIQVEFNPAKVAAYRLVGYEKRMLKAEDFKDDKKDAGEIGAGHTITALYELVPAGVTSPAGKVDDLVFQKTAKAPEPPKQDAELAKQSFLLKLRYKQPDGATSTEIRFPGVDDGKKYTQATADFQFAAAVASFGQLLRDSKHKGNANFASVLELAESAKGKDPGGYRTEFANLVKKAKELKK